LGKLDGSLLVSRADLFVDALTDHDLVDLEDNQWVTCADDIARYFQNGQRSGYLVGRGGDLSLRLYDKSLQIERTGKTHARNKWVENGWQGERQVWRTELQVRRAVLRQLSVATVDDLLRNAGAIWLYGLEHWCRLCCANHADGTRSRWRSHPFWTALLCQSGFDTAGGAGKRFLLQCRTPSDSRKVDQFIGAVTTQMAQENEMDFARALEGLIDVAALVLAQRQSILGIDGSRQISRKVAEKVRRFGTGAAHRVPHRIELRLTPEPRQEGLSYEPED
jgi:hypothetical protein